MAKSNPLKSRESIFCIGLIVLAAVCFWWASSVKSGSKTASEDVCLDSQSEIMDYLTQHSTIFGKHTLHTVTPEWPKTMFSVDADQKHFIYVNGTDTLRIPYDVVKKGKNVIDACKHFDMDSIETHPVGFDDDVQLCMQQLPLDSVYAKQIADNASLMKGEMDSALSVIYNLIVGDTVGHLMLGKENGSWKLYQLSDFPSYTIDIDQLRLFARMHKEHPELSPKECYNNFIQRDTTLGVVYYNIRQDKVLEQQNVWKGHTDQSLQHPLSSLKQFTGWVNYKVRVVDEEKDKTIWKMESAYDYYFNRGRVFASLPAEGMITLAYARWTEPEKSVSWFFYVLIALGCICAIGGVYMGTQSYRKWHAQKQDTREDDLPIRRESQSAEKDPSAELQKTIAQRDKEIEQLKRDMEAFKRNKVQEIAQAKKQAVEDYKSEYNIDNELRRAKNWKNLVGLTSSQSVHKMLLEIQKQHPSFPTLVTINSVYDEAKASSAKSREQMRYLLQYIHQKVDNTSGLTPVFDELCKGADYADNVRDQYESMQRYVGQLAQNKSLQVVLAKPSLNYWDRLAMAYWAMDGFDQMLSTFKQSHLDAKSLSSAKNTMLSDLFQQYAARIFMDSVAQGKTVEQYMADNKQLLDERVAKLASDYAIQYAQSSDEKFTNTCQALSQAYDDIAGTKAFVDRMDTNFVSEFYAKAEANKDKGWYFAMMVGMGYHMVDFVRRRKGVHATLCPNYTYLLSDFDASKLSKDAHFAHNDYAHSVEYTNRVYEWLDELGVKQLKALVGLQLIKP